MMRRNHAHGQKHDDAAGLRFRAGWLKSIPNISVNVAARPSSLCRLNGQIYFQRPLSLLA